MESARRATSQRSAVRSAAASSAETSDLLIGAISDHQGVSRRLRHAAGGNGSNRYSGWMRVIFDPLIESEAINPCWLKLIA